MVIIYWYGRHFYMIFEVLFGIYRNGSSDRRKGDLVLVNAFILFFSKESILFFHTVYFVISVYPSAGLLVLWCWNRLQDYLFIFYLFLPVDLYFFHHDQGGIHQNPQISCELSKWGVFTLPYHGNRIILYRSLFQIFFPTLVFFTPFHQKNSLYLILQIYHHNNFIFTKFMRRKDFFTSRWAQVILHTNISIKNLIQIINNIYYIDIWWGRKLPDKANKTNSRKKEKDNKWS